MNGRLERGRMLLERDRAAAAEVEFRAAIAEDPNAALPRSLLGMCLVRTGKKEAALHEAQQAVALAPDVAFSHFVLAMVLGELERLKDAEAAAREAIRIDPEDADFRAQQASLLARRRLWKEALAAAEAGLALDPEHAGCANLRSLVLTQLGRREEAAATTRSSLARDPDDAATHANQGWTCLHAGDPKQALVHFGEALRLDPNNEWAREGVVEAMKARNVVYRWLLRWFLWMGRLSPGAQAGALIGLWFGARAVRKLLDSHPEWSPVLVPILVLYGLFVVMTWVGDPLFNLLLRLDPAGRRALTKEQTRGSTIVGLCLLGGLLCVAAYFTLTRADGLLLIAFLLGTSMITAPVVFASPAGERRGLVWFYATALVLGAATIVTLYVANLSDLASTLWGIYALAFVGFTFVSNGASIRRPG